MPFSPPQPWTGATANSPIAVVQTTGGVDIDWIAVSPNSLKKPEWVPPELPEIPPAAPDAYHIHLKSETPLEEGTQPALVNPPAAKVENMTIEQCHPNGTSRWTCKDGSWRYDGQKIDPEVPDIMLPDPTTEVFRAGAGPLPDNADPVTVCVEAEDGTRTFVELLPGDDVPAGTLGTVTVGEVSGASYYTGPPSCVKKPVLTLPPIDCDTLVGRPDPAVDCVPDDPECATDNLFQPDFKGGGWWWVGGAPWIREPTGTERVFRGFLFPGTVDVGAGSAGDLLASMDVGIFNDTCDTMQYAVEIGSHIDAILNNEWPSDPAEESGGINHSFNGQTFHRRWGNFGPWMRDDDTTSLMFNDEYNFEVPPKGAVSLPFSLELNKIESETGFLVNVFAFYRITGRHVRT